MIRVGIIGYGYMGQFHKKKIVQSGQARVVAILDKEQRRREEGLSDGNIFQRNYGSCHRGN